MWRAVRVAFQRDRRYGDRRKLTEAFLDVVVFPFAVGEAEAPAIVMDDDGDLIRVVERRGTAIERRVIELPLRRGDPPDQLREIFPVFVITGAPPLRREVELIPPLELGLRWQRNGARLLAADQVTADRDQRFTPLRPQGGDDVSRSRAPVEPGQNRLLDAKSVHEIDDVARDDRRLAISNSVVREKPRRPEAAHIRG